jgi:hypothetical protein
MDIEEFEDLVDQYGEDLAAWPVDLQEPAAALVHESVRARAAIAQAQMLRQALRGQLRGPAPAGLADRIIAAAQPAAATTAASAVAARWFRPAPLVKPGIVLSLCFLIGLASGLLPRRSEPVARLDLPSFFLACCSLGGAGGGNE